MKNKIQIVRLTDEEWRYAFNHGCAQFEKNKDRPESHGFTGDSKQVRIDGAIGEMAVRKAGRFPLNLVLKDDDGPDIGVNGHVRSTKHTIEEWDVRLNIRPGDVQRYPDGSFILVCEDKRRNFLVMGSFIAREVREEWLTDYDNGRPFTYAVPWYELRDVDDAFERIHSKYEKDTI